MKRRFEMLTGALALVLLAAGLTPGVSTAQTASLCTAATSCFVFTPAYVAGPKSFDFYLDGKLVAGNVGLSNSSAVIPTAPGTHWLQLPPAGSAPSAAKIAVSFTFETGKTYDLVLRTGSNGPELRAFAIDATAPAAGLNRSRIVNVWTGSGSLDVELGDPGDKTGGGADASFANVGEADVSDYVEAGIFSKHAAVSIFTAGGADLKAAPQLRLCPADSICSYVLIGPAGTSKTVQYSLAVFPV